MRRGVLRLAALAFGVLGPEFAFAQSGPPPGGLPGPTIESMASLNAALVELDRAPTTIVADVGGRSVTWADVADAIRAMPAVVSGVPFNQIFQNAVVHVMQQKALAVRAEAAGLDKMVGVQRRMKNAADEALASEYLRRSLGPNLAEPALRAVYDGVVAGKPGPDEVQARMIVVDKEEMARELIQRLQGGASFTALAKEFSKDGTAEAGGELDYARRDMLAPEIGAVVFSLGVGQITAFPVKSGNLWFILQAMGRRQVAPPSFAEARAVLEKDVVNVGVPELKRQALKSADVNWYGLAGKKADDKPAK